MVNAPTHKQACIYMDRHLHAYGCDVTIPEAQLRGHGERCDLWGMARVTRDSVLPACDPIDVNVNATVYAGCTMVGEYKRYLDDLKKDAEKPCRFTPSYGDYKFMFIAGEVESYHVEDYPHLHGWGIVDLLTGQMFRRPNRFQHMAQERTRLLVLQYATWINTGGQPQQDEAPASLPLSVDPRGNPMPAMPTGWKGVAVCMIREKPGEWTTKALRKELLRSPALPKSEGGVASELEETGLVKQEYAGGAWSPLLKEQALRIA